MKKLLLSLPLALVGLALFSQGLENIYVERIPVRSTIAALNDDLQEDAVCYRLFVDMARNYSLSVVTGTQATGSDPTFELSIKTSTLFFNHNYGGTLGEATIPQLYGLDSSLIYDSFICMGGIANDRVGVPLHENSDGYQMVLPQETKSIGLNMDPLTYNKQSPHFYTNDGSWVALGGAKGPNPETNTVMIGQFTTNGLFEFELNIQLLHPINNSLVEYYVAKFDNNVRHEATRTLIQYTPLTGKFGANIQLPEITMESPTKDTIVEENTTITIIGNAVDPDGGTISKVELRQNNVKIDEKTTAPYNFSWTPNLGEYKLTLVAIDNDGAVRTTSPRFVQVTEAAAELPPNIELSTPQHNATFNAGDEIIITAIAIDLDGVVDSVEFFVGGVKIGADHTPDPFSISWTAEEGSWMITAKATDNDGLTMLTAMGVTIEVTNIQNQVPVVEITSPANLSSFSAGHVVNIFAETDDPDGTVIKVDFYINNSLEHTDDATPFTFNWTSVAGPAEIKAIATDDDGDTSEPSIIQLDITTGVNGTTQSGKCFIVYPVPATDKLIIESDREKLNKIDSFRVLDITGRDQMNQIRNESHQGTIQVDISSLSVGVYFISVTSGNESHTYRFIKQ